MLPDNYRAISLTKKMGFDIEYLNDGTVKGSLNLKNEDLNECLRKPKTAEKIVIVETEPPQIAEVNKTRKAEPSEVAT
jgi:hypothetical protein